ERFRRYRVHFKFLPRRAYRKKLQATPARILRYMETTFLRRLIDAIKRKMEQVSSERLRGYISVVEARCIHSSLTASQRFHPVVQPIRFFAKMSGFNSDFEDGSSPLPKKRKKYVQKYKAEWEETCHSFEDASPGAPKAPISLFARHVMST
ncbi:hypothetical protein MTO96_045925, partial [Rhipicephalus appendiculatus]